MSALEPEEVEFLHHQQFGRLATIGADGQPHVVPVRYRFDPVTATVEIGGTRLTETKKFADVRRDPRVAFVVDVFEPGPRGIELRGSAAIVEQGGDRIRDGFQRQMLRIEPRRAVSWGIVSEVAGAHGRDITT